MTNASPCEKNDARLGPSKPWKRRLRVETGARERRLAESKVTRQTHAQGPEAEKIATQNPFGSLLGHEEVCLIGTEEQAGIPRYLGDTCTRAP